MQRIPLDSPQLSAVGYDAATAVLQVELPEGDVFRFEGVPVALYFGLLTAAEPEAFFRSRLLFSAYLRTLVRGRDDALTALSR